MTLNYEYPIRTVIYLPNLSYGQETEFIFLVPIELKHLQRNKSTNISEICGAEIINSLTDHEIINTYMMYAIGNFFSRLFK